MEANQNRQAPRRIRERKVSLTDVANAAGVSLGTASKALSGRPGMSEATRERIKRIARQLDYSPSPIAQALASGRSNSIGLLTSDLQGLFTMPVLLGAEDELSERGVTVLLANARGDGLLERSHIEAFMSHNVDALIIVDPVTDPRRPIQVDVPVPVVYAYAPSLDPEDCSVTCDNVGAGRAAVEHMLERGRRKIALICGEGTYKAATDRLTGSIAALRDAGLEPVRTPQFGSWDAVWARVETQSLLDDGVEFDALICQNDTLAKGAMEVLELRGVAVPDDVAVLGHDNWRIVANNSEPKLTTFSNNTDGIGHLAAKLAMDAANGHPRKGISYVPCLLVERGSTPALG